VRLHLTIEQVPPLEQAPLEALQDMAVPPGRDPTRQELEAALHNLDLRAISVQAQAGPAYEHFNVWLDDQWAELNDPANRDIPVPPHINEPYLEASQAVGHILRERAALISQWERAGIEAEVPQRGLPADSLLARLMDEAQAQRLQLRGSLTHLQGVARGMLAERQRLSELVGPAMVEVARRALASLEFSLARIAWSRHVLLDQWDAAGFGADVPHHGLTPEAGLHFVEFEAIDESRRNARMHPG